MKKTLLFILFVMGTFALTSCDSQSGSMVFSNQPINKGEEKNVELKTSFTNMEAVYARAYLEEEIGAFEKEYNVGSKMYKDDFIAELYIDGTFVKAWNALKNSQTAKPEYKQYQFYIYKTSGRPDFPPSAFKKLSPGKHEVEIKVIRKRLSGDKQLAEGKFDFTVK